MEFASELLINALRAGDKIVEVPITLRCDRRGRGWQPSAGHQIHCTDTRIQLLNL
jgi:hypothetical protein